MTALLRRGADPAKLDSLGRTAAMRAVLAGRAGALREARLDIVLDLRIFCSLCFLVLGNHFPRFVRVRAHFHLVFIIHPSNDVSDSSLGTGGVFLEANPSTTKTKFVQY